MRFCYAWLLVLSIPSLALAIFADEAYHIDYHHALLGTPQPHTTFFHRPSAISKASLLYTLSDKFVLGAVNPKDGSIIWRQRLVDKASNETGKALLNAADGDNTIYSAVNEEIQAWDAADGRSVWELRGTGRTIALEVLTADGGQKFVIALNKEEGKTGIVRKLAAETGEVLWELKDDSGDTPLGLSFSKGIFHYISLRPTLLNGYKIRIAALDPLTGVQSVITTLSSDHEVTSLDSILFIGNNHVSPLIVWTDKDFKTVKVNVIGKKHVSSINVRLKNDEEINRITIHAPHAVGVPSHFLVHYQTRLSHWAEIYHANLESGAVEKAFDLPTIGGPGAFATSTHGTNVYFTRNTGFEGTLLSSVQSDILGRWPVRSHGHSGSEDRQGVIHAVSEVVAKGESKFAVRSALVLPSGDWKLLQNGKTLWVRPEGLAGIVAAAFVEPSGEALAEELALESHSNIFTAYLCRLRRHVRDLRHFPGWVQSLPFRIRRNVLGQISPFEVQGHAVDGFGFRKIVIVATERGRLMGLDVGNQGELMWSTQLLDVPVQQKWEVANIETEKGELLIRGKKGEYWRIEKLTGKTIQHHPGGFVADLKTAVSVLDAIGGKLLISAHDDGSLGDYPEAKVREGTLIVTQDIQGTLRGWSLTNDARPALAWEFVPAPYETVATIVARPANDPVASIGKALGDRNVLYKFLNPNILFVATVNFAASTATTYILDSASGQILHTTLHSNVDTSRSITAVMSENWVAYSIFSDIIDISQDGSKLVPQQSKGFQLVISELFESQYPNDRGSLGSLQNFSSTYPVTTTRGETLDLPYVVSQAYSIPGPITLLSVTSTVQGITPRSILCFLPSLKSLISIPRSVVDPRRPVGRDPVPAELEEGLFRYTALLEFDPKWVISHKRDILRLLKAVTSPSRLESTSLVFAFGDVDIFGTRVAPIGGFDLLGKGFGKLQLVGTVVALALGTGVLAPMVRKKQIDGRWKT
ncbi:hypothetical protein MMC07_000807 [Pseudocyphellaria aurata]|nr:hypothetical protein [Pseudocyphellaria aurata]